MFFKWGAKERKYEGALEIRRYISRSDDSPKRNIITEGNMSPNLPNGGCINDIL